MGKTFVLSARATTLIPNLRIVAADQAEFEHVAALFGASGAKGQCWCMWWKRSSDEFRDGSKVRQQANHTSNRNQLRAQFDKQPQRALGLLAFSGEKPIGWCAIEPRENYPMLDKSLASKRIDDKQVWAITCFFVDCKFRENHLMEEMVRKAVEHAAEQGAKFVEAYPVDIERTDKPPQGKIIDYMWQGVARIFREVGFQEEMRRFEQRPIMRFEIKDVPPTSELTANLQ